MSPGTRIKDPSRILGSWGQGEFETDLIGREELKQKIERGDRFTLVNMLSEFAFRSKRIPGSVNVSNLEQAKRLLNPRDEIVVYCSDPNCYASIVGYRRLMEAGFQNVRRFAGGLLEWEAAGYPLEGDDVERS